MLLQALLAMSAAVAAPADAGSSKTKADEVTSTRSIPNVDPMQAFAGMTKLFDTMFPEGPEPDPARLAAARDATMTMFPKGTYAKSLNGFMDRTIDRVLGMSEADFSAMLPAPKEDKKSKDKKKGDKPKAPPSTEPLRVTLAKKEKNFDAKLAAIKAFAATMLVKVGEVAEPKFRDGMARVLARKFDDRQLAEIRTFLATPTGAAYGQEMVGIWFQPEVMRGAFQIFPELMKMLPEMKEDSDALDAQMKSLGASSGDDEKID